MHLPRCVVARWMSGLVISLVAGAVAMMWAASPPTPDRSASFYFPSATGSWDKVSPATVGWNEEKLSAAIALAKQTRASGVVVLHCGRILAEEYWPLDQTGPVGKKARDYGALVRGRDAAGRVIEDVASVQKSVAAILVGMAQSKGLLRLEDPVSR